MALFTNLLPALLHFNSFFFLIWRNFIWILIFPQRKAIHQLNELSIIPDFVSKVGKTAKVTHYFKSGKAKLIFFSPLSFFFCFWPKIESHIYILLSVFLRGKDTFQVKAGTENEC